MLVMGPQKWYGWWMDAQLKQLIEDILCASYYNN